MSWIKVSFMQGISNSIITSLIVLCLSIPSTSGWSQTTEIDSLKLLVDKQTADTARVNILYELTYQLFSHSMDSAFVYARQCHTIGRKVNNPELQCKSWSIMGTCYLYMNEYDSSEYYYNRALEITRQHHIPEKASALFTNMGVLYKRQGKLDKAIEQYLEGLAVDDVNDQYYGGVIKRINIANLYSSQGDLEGGIRYSEEALELIPLVEHEARDRMHSLLLNNLGTIYLQDSMWDRALYYFEESLVINRKINNQNEIARNLHNIGTLKEKIGEARQGLPLLLDALKIREQVDDRVGLIETHMELGTTYSKMNDNATSQVHFDRAIQIAEEIDDLSLLSETYRAQSDEYNRLGNHDLALNALKKSITYHDSLQQQIDQQTKIEMEAKYQTARKDAQLAASDLLISKRTNQRNMYLAAGAILLLGLFYLFDRNKKNKKLSEEKLDNLKKYQKILAMDAMLQGQEDERKRIAQDLHDGLGSLLAAARLQMHTIQREIEKMGELQLVGKTEKLIDTACDEVRRISHDMMPSVLLEHGFLEAIKDLVEELKTEHELLIRYEVKGTPNLDDATTLNVYRIIQEILQNAVKHAHANIIELDITCTSELLAISITDDGVGFDPTRIQSDGIGLKNIRSRVNYLNGKLSFDSHDQKGCQYKIHIPLPKMEVA